MAAPDVTVVIVTLCAELYVPANGEKVGADTGIKIVYAPDVMSLLAMPLLTAIALRVMFWVT